MSVQHLLPLHALEGQLQSIEVEGKTSLLTKGCLLDLFPGGVKYAPNCQLLCYRLEHRLGA